jgi:hypothetical protein
MKNKIIIIGFLLSSISISLSAQLAMGKWRTHLAYNSVSQITQSENKVFAISQGALFSVSKQDGSLEFYSKLNGLSSSNITQIEYDSANKQLLIIYSNGNIDVMGTGGVVNIPDLYNKQMSASKNVNHILFYQNKAFLACDFGIVVLSLAKNEVADTYYIGSNASEVKVLNTTIFNGIIYALSNSTIYQASITEPQLINYQFWSAATGLPGTGDFQKIAAFAGKLILLRGGKLYKQETDKSWTPFATDVTATDFNVSNNTLNIFAGVSTYLVDNLFNVKPVSNLGSITDAEYDAQGNTYYFAANSLGIIAYKQISNETPVVNYFKPVGPALNIPWDLTFSGKKLFVVPGSRWASQNFTEGDVMMYENGIWTNIYAKTIQAQTGHTVTDLMNVAVDPADNSHFFITSYGTGLYEFKNNSFSSWYTYLNSKIETIIPADPFNYMRLDGAVFDKQGNLFMSNTGAASGIKIRLADGTWTQLTYSGVASKPTLGKIIISNQNPNQKWVLSVRADPGIFIFDDNGTLKDQTDDQTVFMSQFTYPELNNSGNTIYTSKYPGAIYSIAQDKNGVMWIGTDIGPFLFNTTSKFDAAYIASRVKIPRGDSTNLADYLLVNEKIKAIAIDGANRKWLGTETSGVYLMSENGQQTIQHFTTTNSPLLSNNILSIAINPVTGETFFGTDQGLISYQSDASEAGETFGNVYAYPNPVRQNYTGLITITGLVENTQVKITDINGNLVCETVSNGSLATWNGKDVHGRRVNTGIYLAICANADGTQNAITKILVIN